VKKKNGYDAMIIALIATFIIVVLRCSYVLMPIISLTFSSHHLNSYQLPLQIIMDNSNSNRDCQNQSKNYLHLIFLYNDDDDDNDSDNNSDNNMKKLYYFVQTKVIEVVNSLKYRRNMVLSEP
jgi:hypothetical protein